MGAATSKSLKMNSVRHFAFAADGVVFLNGSTKKKVGWGLCQLDLATQKVSEVGDTVTRRVSGPYAALTDTVIAVEFDEDLQSVSVVALDRTSGRAGTRYGKKSARSVMGIAASPDQAFVGVLSSDLSTQKPSLEVFEADSGKSVLKASDAAAFAFSRAGDGVVYVTRDSVVHQPLGKGKSKKVVFKSGVVNGVMERRGSLLLSGGTVFDENTGKVLLDLRYRCTTWGAREGTLVGEGQDGLVEIVDLKGKTLQKFFRPRKVDADHVAMSPGGWWLASTGSFLELYDLGDGKVLAKTPPPARAAAVKREVPTSGAVSDPRAAKLLEAFWKNPDDLTPLGVWADLLAEHGDVRAEFIQLNLLKEPTDEQIVRRNHLEKKEAGRLVGPARPSLRQWSFGRSGLVETAWCEADKLLADFEAIAALHPRLTLVVTSLRKKTMATIAELIKLPLSRVWYWRLEANGLSDKAVIALAPGLKGVRHLSLDGNDVTGAGLSGMAPHLAELEFLALGTSMAQREQRSQIVAGWVDALTAKGAFPKLKALHFRGGYSGVALQPDQLKRLQAKPGMKRARVSDSPAHGESVEAWKRGED